MSQATLQNHEHVKEGKNKTEIVYQKYLVECKKLKH